MARRQAGDWRFRIGVFMVVAGQGSTLLVPFVAASSLPAPWKTALSGLLLFGISEVMTIAAIAVMGKAGFDRLKQMFFGFLRAHSPAERVSARRHRVGLFFYITPLALGWATPYLSAFIELGGAGPAIAVGGDLIFLASFPILGGEFWDKVRALFVREATARMPS